MEFPHMWSLGLSLVYSATGSSRTSIRDVQDLHSVRNLRRHQSNSEGTEKKLMHLSKKIGTPKKKLKRISHFSICKMKPSYDKETVSLLLTHWWFTLLKLTNQSIPIKPRKGSANQCSLLLSHHIHLWSYYYLLLAHVWCTCDQLVTHLWSYW